MICTPGRCLQCGASLKTSSGVSPHYSEIQCKLENGMVMGVALCSGCDLSENQWDEAIQAINEYFEKNNSCLVPGIVSIESRRYYKDVIYALHGGKCLGCHQPIEDKHVITGGMLLHEGCNPPGQPIARAG